jgi:S1-C subfamily serine protease
MQRTWKALVPLLVAAAASSPPLARGQELTEQRRIEIARTLQTSAVVVRMGPSGGSGFIVASERWVVTNAHVVQGFRYDQPQVRFGDGTERAATVVAYEPTHDLAVLAVEGEVSVPPLPLADSDQVQVGQNVLAFGSPFGLEGTLTQGIVSARRDLPGIGGGTARSLIQTDAPINPGNSGGPLVNSRGEVIGVNAAILSRTGGSHGIGFAVPSNYVRDLLERLRAHLREQERERRENPRPTRPSPGSSSPQARQQPPEPPSGGTTPSLGPVWLGIFGDDFSSGGVTGVRVQQVIPQGPAAQAGLRGAGDPPPDYVRMLGIPWTGHIILAVDGRPVRSMRQLTSVLRRRRPGQAATLFVTVGPGVVSGEAIVRLAAPPANLPTPP